MKKLFGTDGIRAVAGQSPLDAATVYAIGLALAKILSRATPNPRILVGPPRVLLGMDTRESSDWIAATLTAGLTTGGATVESAGVITTPAVAHLTHTHGFATGIVISASHNPWQDNGIKLFGPDGYKLPDATELAIEEDAVADPDLAVAVDPEPAAHARRAPDRGASAQLVLREHSARALADQIEEHARPHPWSLGAASIGLPWRAVLTTLAISPSRKAPAATTTNR